MKRLTKYDTDGQAMMDCQKCEADWTEKHGESMEECTALYCRNRLKDRVAAYEDTGLAPAEVHSMFGEWSAMMFVLNGIGSYDRLRELAEADKDGRLVVLPCKVGDKLYRVFDGNISEHEVQNMKYFARQRRLGIDMTPFFPDAGRFIGKTVFLTREEAEKALEAMKDGN